MLHPRNKLASGLIVASYLAAMWHGVSAWLWTPQTLAPFVGDSYLVWSVSAIIGGLIATWGHLRNRTKIYEAVGTFLIAYSFGMYFAGILGPMFADDGTARMTQLSAVGFAMFAAMGRSATLYVQTFRENKRAKLLSNALKDTENGS